MATAKTSIEGFGTALDTLVKDIGEKGLTTTVMDTMLAGAKAFWEDSSGWMIAMVAGATALFAVTGVVGLAFSVGIGKMLAKMVLPGGKIKALPIKTPPGVGPRVTNAAVPDKAPTKLPPWWKRAVKPLASLASKAALPLAAGMALYDGVKGATADPDAGFGESLQNAGSSVLNGLSFGMLGSSPAEIAARAAEQGDATAQPAGTQAALMLTEQQVSRMERVSAISFEEFNMSINRLNPNKLSYISDINFTNFADGLKTFAEIPNLQTQFDAVNSLDTDGVISYTSAMEDLVEALNKVNDELAKDNNGLFSSGTGTNAGDMINSVGGLNNGGGAGSEQLNTIMNQVLSELRLIKGFEEATAKNTKNITSGNIARSGASVTGN
jgi:hypothetical protein